MSLLNLGNYLKEKNNLPSLENSFYEFNSVKWLSIKKLYNLGLEEGQRITRQVVIDAFSEFYKGNQSDPVVPFVLAMIWGYGDTSYGPYRLDKILEEKRNIELIKNAIKEMNLKPDYSTAFKNLKEVKGLGISYVSKVMYFAGRGLSHEAYEYPLIFDKMVSKAILDLIIDDKELLNWFLISPNTSYQTYLAYNSLLHKTAKEYNVAADWIEYQLFIKGSNI